MITRLTRHFYQRTAVMLAVMLTAAAAWAQTYTVTLKAGEGTGSDITFSSTDVFNVATSQETAQGGQFWQEGNDLCFLVPECPSTFVTSDAEKLFAGWSVNGSGQHDLRPNSIVHITADITLTACWTKPLSVSFSVTMWAGEGTGNDIVVSTDDIFNLAPSKEKANEKQFWTEGDMVYFKLPGCPDSFSAPNEKAFVNWFCFNEHPNYSAGSAILLGGDFCWWEFN